MSVAAGAQPPNQPSAGNPSRNPPPARHMFNSWTVNTKIKTCKCTVCDERVRFSSQKCDGCGRHVCSECLDPTSSKTQWYKDAARNRMEVGCWACNWRSNMNPAFARRKPAPEVRTEEERRARASKALGARRKAAQTARSRVIASRTPDDDDSFSTPEPEVDFKTDNDEFAGEQLSENIARNVAKRAGNKRKRYTEEDSHVETYNQTETAFVTKTAVRQMSQWVADGAFRNKRDQAGSSASNKGTAASPRISPRAHIIEQSTKSSVAPHLENGSTVIVGAGIVGLFIAYQLAVELREARVKHDVTVLEIRENCSELASGMCLGILSTSGMPELWSDIANEAEDYWKRMLLDPKFPQKINLGTDTVLNVQHHRGFDELNVPSWFKKSPDHSLFVDTECFGRVDPISVAEWLLGQCKALNVSFLFRHRVSDTKFAADSALTHVYVEDTAEKISKIRCNNLVLAAGPFTTGVFNDLFGDSAAVELENHVKGSHCLHVNLNSVSDGDEVVVRLPDAMEDENSLEDAVSAVLFGPNMHVTFSATSSRTPSLSLGREHARHPPKSRTSALRQVAAKYLNREDTDIQHKTKYPDRGRSELSTANGYNPILDKVPASRLRHGKNGGADLNPCGVWLCYGFGSHGTTLAPGAARILVSRMFYGENGLDNYDISLPECSVRKAVGNGKGKARA